MQQEAPSLKKKQPSPDITSAAGLILNFLASKPEHNKYLLFIKYLAKSI
jgi:hypothetical protein